jgi:hypothetical protein
LKLMAARRQPQHHHSLLHVALRHKCSNCIVRTRSRCRDYDGMPMYPGPCVAECHNLRGYMARHDKLNVRRRVPPPMNRRRLASNAPPSNISVPHLPPRDIPTHPDSIATGTPTVGGVSVPRAVVDPPNASLREDYLSPGPNDVD